MTREFLSSDCHWNHGNIIMYCNRPWLRPGDVIKGLAGERDKWVSKEIKEARTREMNEAMVEGWNSVVNPEDEVKHLGDFCFFNKRSGMDAAYWEKKLNGKIIHIKGNHDRRSDIKGMLNSATMKAGGYEFFLQHHPPSRIEEIPDFCDVVLCGHVHEAWDHKWVGGVLVVNVGVDVRAFLPWSVDNMLAEVDSLMSSK